MATRDSRPMPVRKRRESRALDGRDRAALRSRPERHVSLWNRPPEEPPPIRPVWAGLRGWHRRCSAFPPMMASAHRPPLAGDARLLDALRRGDPAAADALVEAYGSRIYRIVNRILASRADAEEVAQDVLLTILRRFQSFGGRSTFATWVQRVATNAALARLRRRRRADAHAAAVSRASDVIAIHMTGADAELVRYERGEVLARAIARSEERRVGKECRSRWSPYH